MFLNNATTAHPVPGSLGPRRTARTIASAATMGVIDQARRIRVGHLSFVLGITLAVAAVTSLGAFDSGASPRLQTRAPEMINGIDVSTMPAAPIYIALVGTEDEANRLLAESYYLQTAASGSGSVILP